MFTLVPGASGHVGNNLVRTLLAEGRNVRVLIHRDSATLDKLDVEKIQGDIRDADSLNAAVKGADTVYHLAAMVSIETSGWDDLHSINTPRPLEQTVCDTLAWMIEEGRLKAKQR